MGVFVSASNFYTELLATKIQVNVSSKWYRRKTQKTTANRRGMRSGGDLSTRRQLCSLLVDWKSTAVRTYIIDRPREWWAHQMNLTSAAHPLTLFDRLKNKRSEHVVPAPEASQALPC